MAAVSDSSGSGPKPQRLKGEESARNASKNTASGL
jgi:hypothetical protein